MKIKDLQAYKNLIEMFNQKGYSQGVKNDMPIYTWNNVNIIPDNLTPGHYVGALSYGNIRFKDIPKQYLTREFFLHALSGAHEDVVKYVKSHLAQFDKQFFKDHIATNYYSLEFKFNDFEYMPLEYIDEEMVACAMLASINMRYIDRRGDCEEWFYSVYKRKPEVLTQDLYTLGARCFAKKYDNNPFLDITPEKYRTTDYYFALCLQNDSKVMEDIPEEILTQDFLLALWRDNHNNIECFSEYALEKEIYINFIGEVKFWQFVILADGYRIENIPLNDERVDFFLSLYGKDTSQYRIGFKDHYKEYLRHKNSETQSKSDTTKIASDITIVGALTGIGIDSSIDIGNKAANKSVNRQSMLPIRYTGVVPDKYSKKYDQEEYLIEIYKKIGIQVLKESDSHYYNVIMPENLSIVEELCGYCLKNSNEEVLIHYYDRGPFYDRSVAVDKINVTL